MSLNNNNNITHLIESKSQNKYDLNNVELSLTNSIDNYDFILLKNGTLKPKRKKDSYFEGYLDNKRLNKAIENSNKKRVKSCANVRNNINLFYKTNFDGIKSMKNSIHSDTNIFNKAQKINIFENVIINNVDNNSLKLSYSYNNDNSRSIQNKSNKKDKYNKIMNIKKKKIEKYENLIKTKNMYKDLYKNLKKKNDKKNFKNKNNSNKKSIEPISNKLNYKNKDNIKEEELNNKMKYDYNNNLMIIKSDIIEYNKNSDKNNIGNKSDLLNKTNKTLKLNLNNLLVFKNHKGYKHFDCLGNNYNYYERNESDRKKNKNENNNEFINIINKIKNETNKTNVRNTYNLNYGYNPGYNMASSKEYGNHHFYVSNNINYDNKKSTSNLNHKSTSINMNKVNKNFKKIENITDTIKNNHVVFKDTNFNNTKTYISNTYKKEIKERDDSKMKRNKSYNNKENKIDNISSNYFNKSSNNNENHSLNKNMKKNKSYLTKNKYNLSNKSLSNKGEFEPTKNFNNLKKYETKMVKTNFDYSNKPDENIIINTDYNNINRKEIKYCNTEKKNNKKNNYNYFYSNQYVKHYKNFNMRNNYNEEEKTTNDIKNNYINTEINRKTNEEKKINFEPRKEKDDINKLINYHSPHVNHNFLECKKMNPKKMNLDSQNRNNNNTIINSHYKKDKNVKIKTVIMNDKIKENLNEKFKNITKINSLLNQKNTPIIQYNSPNNNNHNLINNVNNIEKEKSKTILSNKSVKFNDNDKEENIHEKFVSLKKMLKGIKRMNTYSQNKTINNESNFNNINNNKNNKTHFRDENLVYDHFNQQLNFSKSSKLLKKVKKEKNEITKKFKIRQYLTQKSITKIPSKNRRKSLKRNKSYDSIMPPNNLDEIFTKNIKFFKFLNRDY